MNGLAQAAGHADRAMPLKMYCAGLLLPGERKSVEPMAARLAPENVRRMHQSLHHIGSTWCKLMHSDPMWPINGKYQCRKCHRYRVVTWEAHGSLGNFPLK